MKRKITAWFLLMLMVVFTTMAHSGLRYCLCKKVVFIGECECQQIGISSKTDVTENEQESDVQNTCSCCVQETADRSSDDNEQPDIEPCSFNCIVDLTLHIDDFILTESDKSTSKLSDEIQLVTVGLTRDNELVDVILSPDIHAPRGSPPPYHRFSVPIYKRDSVYRL